MLRGRWTNAGCADERDKDRLAKLLLRRSEELMLAQMVNFGRRKACRKGSECASAARQTASLFV